MSTPELSAEAFPIHFHIAEVFGGTVQLYRHGAPFVMVRGQSITIESTPQELVFVYNETTGLSSKRFNPNAADACFVAADRAAKLLPPLRKYTLREIVVRHIEGNGRFFSRENMRFAGDTLRSFKVRNMPDGKVLLERVQPRRDRNGRSMGGVGELHRVNLETGDIMPAGEG